MPNDALPQEIISAVLDTLIPARDESLPGAGSLGIGASVEPKLGGFVRLVAAALAALAALPVEERAPLVGEVDASHPGFVESLVYNAYTAYYQDPRVAVALGLKSEPPHPGGYEL